jgi:hypothetical protein
MGSFYREFEVTRTPDFINDQPRLRYSAGSDNMLSTHG